MSLIEIRNELARINEQLFYGEIDFTYDAMGFTMAFSHPAELLGDMCGELDMMLEYGNEDPAELEIMLGGLEEIRFSFDLVQLKDAIDGLRDYINENK